MINSYIIIIVGLRKAQQTPHIEECGRLRTSIATVLDATPFRCTRSLTAFERNEENVNTRCVGGESGCSSRDAVSSYILQLQ